ncbi:MAG: DUF349 domain-containing protein [Gammaproteobacteria bacterium]|nr:DUF349 domain-containing protein [Gammaproteobacteria bacterium]
MMFKRIFNTDWLKSNRKKNRNSNQSNSTEQAILDPDPARRLDACQQLQDLPRLQQISQQDEDAEIRKSAAARLVDLLSGSTQNAPDLETRLTCLTTVGPELAGRIALNGDDRSVRLAALAQVNDSGVLVKCALNDGVAAVRLAAAERLKTKEDLEQVARNIGKRDKSVYRLVKNRLKVLSEQEEAPLRVQAEAKALCERAEKIGLQGSWTRDKALLDHVQAQWADLGGSIPASLEQRFRKACDKFLAALTIHQEEDLARERIRKIGERALLGKQDILDELSDLDPLHNGIEPTESRIKELGSLWTTFDNLPEAEEKLLEGQFKKLASNLESKLRQQRDKIHREQGLKSLTDRARSWLEGNAPLQHQQLAKWIAEGDRLQEQAPETTPARDYLATKQALQSRLEKQTHQVTEKMGRLPDRLRLLEQHLDEGELKQAIALHQSLNGDIDLIRATGLEHGNRDTERHFRQLTPRLRELQNWRKWGTDQHRLDMCDEMEGLITADIPLDDLTDRVQGLQKEWKKLDRDGTRVNDSLKKRFRQAADTAFDRCRPYLDEQARQKEANLKARKALCEQLETFLDQIDWERVDWKKVVKAERETRTAWGQLGPVAPRNRRELDRRYRNAMKKLDAQLATERSRNKALKLELIEKAAALAENPDLEQAIKDIKALQRQWHTTVASKRAQENRLWERFREKCDQIFNRRREADTAHQTELKAHSSALRKLCETLEGLGSDSSLQPDELQQELGKQQSRWNDEFRHDLPKGETNRLLGHWQKAVEGVKDRIRVLREQEEHKQIKLLRSYGELCRSLEKALQTDTAQSADTETWRQRLVSLEPLSDPGLQQAINARLDQALNVLGNNDQRNAWMSDFANNLEKRRQLCLSMEILAGVDSPDEEADGRLAYQVSRLSGRLADGKEFEPDDAISLERAWYLTGPVASQDMDQLQSRFDHALNNIR